MLNESLLEALNRQIADEFYASYLYLAIAAYFEELTLPGFANWMRAQSEEERTHAMKIYDYVLDRGGRVVLLAVGQPPSGWDSPLAAFEAALGHEQGVTRSINEIYALARDENDYPTQVMMEWFIAEQVEEEKSAGDVVARLKFIDGDPTGLLVLDQQLGTRVAGEDPGAPPE